MKGSISASVVAPPRPGSSPTQKPTPMPASMKAKAFHCRTRSSPSNNASNKARLLPPPCQTPPFACGSRPPYQGGKGRNSFAELYVLAEFIDDVLRLVQDAGEDLLRFVARRELEIELRLRGFLLAIGILDRRGEGVAHHLDDVGRRVRRQHIGARDLLGRRAQRHDRFRARLGRGL